MGIIYHGTTSLKLVTGAHKRVRKHINPKTKLPTREWERVSTLMCSITTSFQRATRCLLMLASGLTTGNCSKTMLHPTRQSSTRPSLLTMCILWPDQQSLICSQQTISLGLRGQQAAQALQMEKRKEKTTPVGVNLMRRQVLYRAAQVLHRCKNVEDLKELHKN